MIEQKEFKIELEKIVKETDEVAERLGPEIRNRMIEIEQSGVGYAIGAIILGGLATAKIGYSYCGLSEMSFQVQCLVPSMGGMFSGVTLGNIIGDAMQKRAYRKLDAKYPEKADDIKRCRQLADTYLYDNI